MRVKSTAPTISDVAKRAFVSVSTVSHVLNGTRFVEEDTRQRVLAAAAELGYRASSIARSLATHRTATVGVIVRSLSDLWMSEIVPPIEGHMREAGHEVFISTHHGSPETEREVLKTFRDRRVDGIVVLSSGLGEEYSALQEELQVPIVLVGPAVLTPHTHRVDWDDSSGARAAVEHLVALGHRRIGFLGHASGALPFLPTQHRLEVYSQVLLEASVPFDPELVVPGDRQPEGGFAAMQVLLALPRPPTAIFCFNDLSALGALSAAHAAGQQVPGDISIVGFDDLALARFSNPPLTTVRADMHKAGEAAASMLLDLIRVREVQAPLTLPTHLVVRASTARISLQRPSSAEEPHA